MRSIKMESSIELQAPASLVFDFVADQTNAPRWQTGLHEVQRITPGGLGVGTEHEFVRRFAGMSIASRNRFIEYQPDRFVAFEIPSGKLTGIASYLVEPTGPGSSRLTSTVDFHVAGPARFATPLLARTFKRDLEKNLVTLKALVEHTGLIA